MIQSQHSLSPQLKSQLNERQQEAAVTTDGPLIVLAGAGSGKTKMLTSRITYLIEELRVPSYQILAVTFTNKAANEMKERIQRNLQQTESSLASIPEVGTFHSVCIRILRREIHRTPFTKPFVIYDDSDQLSLIKRTMADLAIDDKAFNPKAIQGAINRAKCDAREPEELEVAQFDVFARQVKRVYEQYQKNLFANNALDFGEIICMTYRLFRDNEDIRHKYQRRYLYIHVDEYQDTNRAQYLLLSQLAKAAHGGHQNICVVGDEDQSIYKWRGADIRNILDFENDYPGARVVKLEQNYRSTKNIITAAGHVIRNNKSRKDKTLWTENEQGRPLVRAQLADERAEAEMVVNEIKILAEKENRTFGDFAIFYRTNAQSRQFEDVLRREKIPYQVVGGLRFYDRKEIKDVMAYFRVILNPTDSVSLRRIINVPARGIGKTTLDRLDQLRLEMASGGESPSYWEILNRASQDSSLTSASVSKKLGKFLDLVKRLTSEQPNLLLSELYHLILDETGYVRELRQEGTEESMSRVENLEELDSLLQEFEEDELEGLTEGETAERKPQLLLRFIEQSTLASDVDEMVPNSTVKLMTLHSSKGLEFPVVFMVGMEEGLFPSIKAWEETPEEDIEEERRLCYVGMTRAREILYMLNTVIRRIWGQVSYQEPSRFFMEMPDDMIEMRDFSLGSRAGVFKTGSSRHFGYHSGYSSGPQRSERLTAVPSYGSPSAPDALHTNEEWVGRQMLHPEYGRGTVVASDGSGAEQKVTVRFQGQNEKKFLLRYVASYFG